MAQKIENYLNDEGLQNKVRKNTRNMVENVCSVDNFINGFVEARSFVLSKSYEG